ncbi:hypothetical protein BMS3Bbin04_01585 [bacterium BMS3Bbin04]|nr:hypothetical protein BMS3Bbin04_01585 [bacterium BMS3Bbin04]
MKGIKYLKFLYRELISWAWSRTIICSEGHIQIPEDIIELLIICPVEVKVVGGVYGTVETKQDIVECQMPQGAIYIEDVFD